MLSFSWLSVASYSWRSMSWQNLLVLCRLIYPSHRHWYSSDWSTNVPDLGPPNASITESYSECHLWLGRLVRLTYFPSSHPPEKSKLALTQWKRGTFTEACRNCSVTIIAIVRLVYLIKTIANSTSLTTNLANILIWTGVEVNVSIICGQYKASLPAVLKTSSSVVLESLFVAIQ